MNCVNFPRGKKQTPRRLNLAHGVLLYSARSLPHLGLSAVNFWNYGRWFMILVAWVEANFKAVTAGRCPLSALSIIWRNMALILG